MDEQHFSINRFSFLIFLALTPNCIIEFPALADGAIVPSTIQPASLGGAKVTGEIQSISGSSVQLLLRGGQTMMVDLSAAKAKGMVPPIYVNEFVEVQGSLTGAGTMTAAAVARAKSAPAAWGPDIP